jgi:hypothetical protein
MATGAALVAREAAASFTLRLAFGVGCCAVVRMLYLQENHLNHCLQVVLRMLLPNEDAGENTTSKDELEKFNKFRRRYFSGFLPAMLADWMMVSDVVTTMDLSTCNPFGV